MNEKEITEDQVRMEHMANVNAVAHYLYFAGVIGGSFILMVALIALLGAGGG